MIIGMIVGIILGLAWALFDDGWFEDYVSGFFTGALVGGLIGFFAISMPIAFSTIEEITVSHDLRSISDGSETTGGFFLGSGVVDEEAAFYYYRETDDGGAVLESEGADRATIYETTDTPHIELNCDKYGEMNDFTTFPMNVFIGEDGVDCYGPVDFYVPEGSITNDFTLDGELQ